MSGLGSAVEVVSSKFSALGVMAVTALVNITNSAINAGKQLLHSLTIAPITQGFQEYELKMGSVQTIMASTGESLETVNKYLQELNEYSDKTIYSFSDMTTNIGKFTNAGVKLEDAVKAIQGISNEAAVSGANANEASRAMYNFAQALSAGHVKLIDWKSIENANMATVEFKTQLLESAVAAGTLSKTADGMYQVLSINVKGDTMDGVIDATHNFNDSLQYQWMTTEALVTTLGKYADETTEIGKKAFAAAQDVKTFSMLMDTLKEAVGSGWAQTWEILVGDFEEAKKLFTDVSNVLGNFISASSDARNNVLQSWKDLGGRTAIIDALRNAFEGVLSIIKPVQEAFAEIFPPVTAKQLLAFSEGLKELTSHLKLSDASSENLKRTFKGLFAVLDIIKQAFSAVFKAISPLFGGIGKLGDGILDVTAFWGDWLVYFDDVIKQSDFFNKVLVRITDFVKMATTAVRNFIQIIKEKFVFPGLEIFHKFLERVHERASQVGDAFGKMKSGVSVAIEGIGKALSNSKFIHLLEKLWESVKIISGGIAKALGDLAGGIIDKLGNANFSGVFDLLNGLSLGGIALGISKFLKSFTEPLSGLKGILDGITGILDGVRGSIEAYQTKLKADTLLKIAAAIAVLAASILVVSLIDSEKLSASLGAITLLFGDLMASMDIFEKISGNKSQVAKATTAMIGMSVAILILSAALKQVGELGWEELAKGLAGVVGLTATMVAAAKIMGSGGSTITKGATQMVIFAASIKILASVCEDLAKVSWEELAKGLLGVGVLLAEISIFLNTAKFSGKSITTATGIVILAAAIKILASACKDFAAMEWEEIAKGLASIGALLLEVEIFTKNTGNVKHVISTGVALIAIGAAMKIFASAAQDMAKMSWEELARGLSGMAGTLLAVTLALNFMPKNMVSIGVGLIAMSTALVILANALGKMGGMSWDEIARGLTVLGGSVAILAVGLNVMKGALAGSAAMLIAVAALAALTPILSVLGAMSWESIAKGLVAIAGAFTIIGVAGIILTPLVPTILALAGAFALIGLGMLGVGVGLLAAGAGLSALAVGFTALALAVTGGATAIVAALTAIIVGIVGLIPVVIRKIGEVIIELCKVISESAPEIAKAVEAVVLSLVDVLVECVPPIVDGVLLLLVEVLASIVKYTPQIVDSLLQFLIAVLDGIARNLPTIIKSAIDVIMAFFSGIADALSGIDTDILLKGIVGIGLLSAIMLALGAVAPLIPGAMLGILGMGVVVAELALVLAAVGAFAQLPGLSWLIGEGGKLLEGIGAAIGSFVGGIAGGFMSAVSSQFPKIGTDLSSFMANVQPFIAGAKNIDKSAMDGVKALAETILILTAANILDGLTSWFTGGSSMSKFGKELAEFGPYFNSYYNSIKGVDGSVVQSSANAAKALVEMANNLPNNGGVVGWFAGENDLSSFADELAEFGPVLKKYADSVRDLDPNVIVNSANAAKALAEMSNNLPNQGGVASWFTGENKLSIFGDELLAFGPSLKQYADSVRGLDPAIVMNSANAAKALSELASNLPNTGGVVSWFTGDNDMGTFGNSLVSFGENFAKYSTYVSGINIPQLSAVIAETNKLVAMAKGMAGLDTGAMSNFGSALTNLAKNGVDGFISAFNNASPRVSEAASSMLTKFINAANAKKTELSTTFTSLVQAVVSAVNNKQNDFQMSGSTLMVKFISGVKTQDGNSKTAFANIISGCLTALKNKYTEFTTIGSQTLVKFIGGVKTQDSSARAAFTNIISGILTAIKDKYSEFSSAGQEIISRFIDGIKVKETSARDSFTSSLAGVVTAIRKYRDEFYSAGAYLVDGFVAVIGDNIYKAEAKAKAMAQKAAEAAEKELAVKSPSKRFYKIGDYAGQGFVNALGDYEAKAAEAGSGMAESAINSLNYVVSRISEFINNNIDSQPAIRPVLDLSNVEEGKRKLNALFSRTQAISVSASMNRSASEELQNGVIPNSNGNTYQFTQNNYSPKALSRVEIYRQTRNQFSALREAVGT
jgi:hypothetical protein